MEIVLSYLFDFTAHWVTSIFGLIVIVISKFLKRYSKAKRIRAPAYSRALRRIKGGSQRGVKKSSGPISRVPGRDRVAVRVGVVDMGRGNDLMGQGIGVFEEMRF